MSESPPMLAYGVPDAIARAVHRPRYVTLACWAMLAAVGSLVLPVIALPFVVRLACLALWTPLAGYVAFVQYQSVWRARTAAADAAVVMSGVIAFFSLFPALIGVVFFIDDDAALGIALLPFIVLFPASVFNTATSYAWWRILAARDALI